MNTKLFIAVLFCLFSIATAAWIETAYTATLDVGQVSPPPNDPPAFAGTAICILDRNSNPKTLDCELQTDVDVVTGAYVGVGAPQSGVGTSLYQFTDYYYAFGASFRQQWNLVDFGNTYLVDDQIEDFLNGNFFITVLSDNYPNGVIRGQIKHQDRVYSRLNTGNTIPPASGSSATGVMVGTYSFQNPLRDLEIDFIHNVANPTATEIREGEPGEVGPQVYAINGAENAIYHQVTYTVGEEEDFLYDLHYMNILSETNPSGAIRGQMITIDYVPNISFTSRLDGDQEVPSTNTNNRGGALVSFSCSTGVMEYLVMHNVDNPTGAFIHGASEGSVGNVLFELSRDDSPIYGSKQLTAQEELLLYNRQMYINIISPSFPNGEIRGQIDYDNDWYAYLSGTNVVPPVTTSAVGLATFRLKGDFNRILDYAVFHNVQFPTSAYITTGPEGVNTNNDRKPFPSFFSPIRGDSFVFDDDDLEALVTDNMYVTVYSNDYPNPGPGEIRGQIRRIDPCQSSFDNVLTLSISEDIIPDTPVVDDADDGNDDVSLSLPSLSLPSVETVSYESQSGTPIRVGQDYISTRTDFSARFIPPSSMFDTTNIDTGRNSASNTTPILATIFAMFLVIAYLF